MEINDFLENFLAQFEDVGPNKMTIDTSFRDIENWSSLTALSIIAMVDEFYKVKLTGDDIRSSRTIGDIFSIVKSKL